MPLERGVQLAQGGQQRGIEKAPAGQHTVEQRRGVSLGQQEAVPVRVLGMGGVQIHLVKVETDQDLYRR